MLHPLDVFEIIHFLKCCGIRDVDTGVGSAGSIAHRKGTTRAIGFRLIPCNDEPQSVLDQRGQAAAFVGGLTLGTPQQVFRETDGRSLCHMS